MGVKITGGFAGLDLNPKEPLTMKTLMINLLRDEQGQDLIEYTLLLAFVALASAALFIGAGGNVQSIWGNAQTNLASAASASS
jgi:Flp pilus assembly pilin Flp